MCGRESAGRHWYQATGCGHWTGGTERGGGVDAALLSGTNAEGVLGEAQADAALDAIVELDAVQFVEGLCGKGHVLELDEAHGSVLFGAKAESFVATLLGEHGFQLVLGRIDG